jgi:hypothetical protein
VHQFQVPSVAFLVRRRSAKECKSAGNRHVSSRERAFRWLVRDVHHTESG